MTKTYRSFDDFLVELEIEQANETRLHRWLRNIGFLHFLHRLREDGFRHVLYTDILRPIKFFYQRLTRGYDDSCMWSLDHHLAKLILPRLKLFRQQPHGCPAGSSAGSSDICFHPTDAEGDPDLAAWDEKLDKMVYAFEYIASGKSWEYEMTLEQEAAEDRKVAEGLELFGKYFRGLWN
jgi:hypothetical protein